ncbi:MAG: hypothetical protein MZW92_38260 [Comamonadaceae bacterium]|nr:hypothetical protein [Comamonadaceae bacterium]
MFPLPLTYATGSAPVDGVRQVSRAELVRRHLHSEAQNFFPQFAVDAPTYFDALPGVRDRRGRDARPSCATASGAVVGRKLAQTSTASRSATAMPLQRHDLPRHLGVQRSAPSTTARTPSTDTLADASSTGTTSTRR